MSKDSWVCQTCGKQDGLRTMDDVCRAETKDGSTCGGRVIYKAIVELHDIKKENKE